MNIPELIKCGLAVDTAADDTLIYIEPTDNKLYYTFWGEIKEAIKNDMLNCLREKSLTESNKILISAFINTYFLFNK